MAEDKKRHVGIDYTNHRGERQMRAIEPRGGIQFGISEWHPDKQWLLHAFDLGKGAVRTFAMAGIHGWYPPESPAARVELSLAKQLQASMELNARMKVRLGKLRDEFNIREVDGWQYSVGYLSGRAVEVIKAILKDEEPTWPPA
jgi:predicted DNA-binding transcriptional regulator YafY